MFVHSEITESTAQKGGLEECCHFEIDGRGNVMDFDPKPDRKVCRDCGE